MPPLSGVDAAEEPQGDQDDPDKDQDRPRHPELCSLEALLFSHADKDKGGPNGHESKADVQQYLDIALFFLSVNFYCLNKSKFFYSNIFIAVLPEQKSVPPDASKLQGG